MPSNVTPMKAAPSVRYLSPEQVAEMAPGITVETLRERRKRRQKPDYFKPTGGTDSRGAVLYLESDVLAWIAASRVTTREAS
ncbi:helix-turn-helix transcriptional regulator [Microbacterium gilvum]|uniref:Helix-turn-helix domain-containing protein n=1 Tax=Microbacterium gilvum TaxID=1336204 RepID=A0ABP8ZPL1_9MICO